MSSGSADMTQAHAPKNLTSTTRDFLILGGLLVLFLVGLAGVAAATGWEETWEQIRKLTLLQVGILLVLSLVNYFSRSLRWHVFGSSLGLRLPASISFIHFFGGFALSITPGRIGELIRIRWISRMTSWRPERISPLPLVDRAFDLAGMGLLLAAGVMLSSAGTWGAVAVAVLALVSALIATRPILLEIVVVWIWRTLRRWPRIFVRLRSAARSIGIFSTPATGLTGLALSIVGWLAECAALYALLYWMGTPIDLSTAVVIFIFSTLAGGLTGAPGGIGGAEAAMVFLLGLNGVPLETALPATAVIRLTTLWFAIGLGLVAFPVAERISKRIPT